KAQLPLATRVLIAASDFFRNYLVYLIIGIIAAGFGFRQWLKNPNNRRKFHHLVLRLPLMGKLTRGFNTARFTRTFSILSGSAVPVLDASGTSADGVRNLPMRDAVIEASQRVREGAPIGRSLGTSKLFPPMTIHLISSGESSGELEAMLERCAVSQERELD